MFFGLPKTNAWVNDNIFFFYSCFLSFYHTLHQKILYISYNVFVNGIVLHRFWLTLHMHDDIRTLSFCGKDHDFRIIPPR